MNGIRDKSESRYSGLSGPQLEFPDGPRTEGDECRSKAAFPLEIEHENLDLNVIVNFAF